MTVLLLLLTLGMTVGAEEKTPLQMAEELDALGMLKGTGSSYELERQPSRMEMLIMLIRLLGAEEEVLEGKWNHPFSDVPEWGDPYVGYAYEYGLTNGIAKDRFSPDETVGCQTMMTFTLRALGYDDAAGDFSYSESIAFAKEVGLADYTSFDGEFLRADMITIAYLALDVCQKDSQITLREHLLGKEEDEDARELPDVTVLSVARGQVRIGDTSEQVIEALGTPERVDTNEYGAKVYIYNRDYTEFLTVTVYNGIVEGFSSSAASLNIGGFHKKLGVHAVMDILKDTFGMQEGLKLTYSEGDYRILCEMSEISLEFWFDLSGSCRLDAVSVYQNEAKNGLYSSSVLSAFAKMAFDLSNAYRAEQGLLPLEWSQNLAKIALHHSEDMAKNNMFSHNSTNGKNYAERLDVYGVNWVSCAENLSAGSNNVFAVVYGWINSDLHRKNICSDYTQCGVGICIRESSDYRIYYTQDFYR